MIVKYESAREVKKGIGDLANALKEDNCTFNGAVKLNVGSKSRIHS